MSRCKFSALLKKSTRGKNPFVLIKDKVKWDIRGKYNTNRCVLYKYVFKTKTAPPVLPVEKIFMEEFY